ncbi:MULTISPECIES: e9imm peptide [unclassified Streptomyces]|uniref:e9imm peptide n=1 Tax=unclassified Streptomyces TaxID=2593676 RepID=UPI0033C6E7E1
MSRDEAVRLVRRLMDGAYADEAEGDAMMCALRHGTGCPHISDYIFWDHDPELTAEKVVDWALAYEPVAL